jgi:hypothetical protein
VIFKKISIPASSAMCTPSRYGNISGANSCDIEKYAYEPIVLCKNSITENTIMPSGSCALVLAYILPNTNMSIPSTIMLAIETPDKIAEVDSI